MIIPHERLAYNWEDRSCYRDSYVYSRKEKLGLAKVVSEEKMVAMGGLEPPTSAL
jgi:hypothetical protein